MHVPRRHEDRNTQYNKKKMKISLGLFCHFNHINFNQEVRKYERTHSHKKKNLMISIQLFIRNRMLFFASKFG